MARIEVCSPMVANVLRVLVAPGDLIRPRQEVVVLESMKMEIPVEAPAAGKVIEVCVAEAQRVTEGQVLLRLEA
jgi:biotin carboxyl carrier protein